MRSEFCHLYQALIFWRTLIFNVPLSDTFSEKKGKVTL